MKQTDALQQELMASSDLSRFLTENEDNFETMDCGACLMRLAEGMDCSKAELARRAGMSTVYLYQVFSGRRRPSRDRMISLCFGLECSVDTAQELLKKTGFQGLYPKNRRDAIILYCLDKGYTLQETNERLFQEHEESLC